MRLETIEKEVTRTKFTMTPDRITVKFPMGTTQEQKVSMVRFAQEIYSELQPDQAWRGSVVDSRGFVIMSCERGGMNRKFWLPRIKKATQQN